MIDHDINRVCNLIDGKTRAGKRTVVAIAGPPASGKSTLADCVVRSLNSRHNGTEAHAALLPMDGYHLDNRILESQGLLARKGAPETFDAEGFCHAVHQLAHPQHEGYYPRFDRQLDLAIANAIAISTRVQVVVVEGNYLLLKSNPWRSLRNVFAASVFVCPTLEELQDRLFERWISHGLDSKAAWARASQNDLPNAKHVMEESHPADLHLNQNYAEQGGRYAY
ncbi:MAG: uridine kinase [Pseudomonadota bacterium]